MRVTQKTLVVVAILSIGISLCVSAKPKNTPKLADIDPFSVGSVTFATDALVPGSIEQRNAEESFDARLDEMSLLYSTLPNKFCLYFDAESRAQIITAALQYSADYENHALNEKRKNNAYGKMKTRITWGGLAMSAMTHATITLGYRFVDSSPYFTLTIPDAKDEISPYAQVVLHTGPQTLYFTRAQLEAFCATLDPDTIKAAVDEIVKAIPSSAPDTY